MAQGRKIIHNMEDAAQSMIDYVLKAENHPELVALIADVSDQYKQPFESYVWAPLYYIFGWRMRVDAVDQLKINAADENNKGRLMLIGLINFMKMGGWKETSANTNFMLAILARLPQYKLIDPNPRTALTLDELKELHVVFEAKAQNIINPVKADLTQSAGVRAELDNLPKRNIRDIGINLPENSEYRKKQMKKEWLPANKTVKANFKDIMETLETLYTSRKDNIPATKSGVTAKKVVEPVKPVDDAVVEAHIETQASITEIFTIPPAPPPPPAFCDAAFSVAEKVVKGQQAKYSATPNKLTVSNETKLMAATLFAIKANIPIAELAPHEENTVTMSLGNT